MNPLTYRAAGVDIDAGEDAVRRIAPLARATARPEVLAGVGGFAAFVRVPSGYREPVMVSSADGVGTKLKVAFLADRHDTVGVDLVAMGVNDVLVHGAEPLYFLDYIGTARRVEPRGADVVEEIQGLGAVDEDVVHAHRDQVDPDGVVAVGEERDLELGADAIGGGDHDRLAVARRHAHEGGESADTREDLGARGRAREGRDAPDCVLAGV